MVVTSAAAASACTPDPDPDLDRHQRHGRAGGARSCRRAAVSPGAAPAACSTERGRRRVLGTVDQGTASSEGRSFAGVVLSVLLIGAGVLGLLHAAGVVSVSLPIILAGALIFVGVALVISAWTGGTGGLIAIAAVLTIALAVASVVRVPLSGGVGDRRWVPSSAEEVRTYYKHGAGDVLIDLSHVAFPAEGQLVRSRLGVGHLKVVLPDATRVAVQAHTGAGDIRLLDRHEEGLDV